MDVFEERFNSVSDEVLRMKNVVEMLSCRQLLFDEVLFVVNANKKPKGTSKKKVVVYLEVKLNRLVLLYHFQHVVRTIKRVLIILLGFLMLLKVFKNMPGSSGFKELWFARPLTRKQVVRDDSAQGMSYPRNFAFESRVLSVLVKLLIEPFSLGSYLS